MTKEGSLGFTPAPESSLDPKDRVRIENIYVRDLIPYVNNPRNNDETVKTLSNSMSRFGTLVLPVITRDGIIVTGHTRLKAAIELGKESLKCIVAEDLSDVDAKMFRLADNKIQESSTWDFDKLAIELREVGELGFEIEDFNFTPLDLDPFCFDDDDDGSESVMLTEEQAAAAVGTGARSACIEQGDEIRMDGLTLVCGPLTLDALIEAVQACRTDEGTSCLYEPDPSACEALARGWMEETGGKAVVTRDGETVDVLRR